jgi:subtilisin-like proprotein convertase family protein
LSANPLKQLLRIALATALAGAGLAFVSTASPASATAPCTRTYSASPGTPIHDNGAVSSVIDVPEDGLVVTKAIVGVNIHHTWDSDLIIQVQSETDGSVVRAGVNLSSQNGGNGDNYLGTFFDEDAATSITDGALTPPFTGTFKPETSLLALNGLAGGKYRLTVVDTATIGEGTLDNWSVTLTYASCDPDNDGLDVPPDACPALAGVAPSGCPAATGALTAKYRHGKFKGALTSSNAACKGSRLVSIYKVRSGADKRVGAASTAPDGTYKLTRAKHAGRYYATTPRIVVANAADCAAAQSATFRVR